MSREGLQTYWEVYSQIRGQLPQMALHCNEACVVATSSMGQDGSEPVCASAGGLSQ